MQCSWSDTIAVVCTANHASSSVLHTVRLVQVFYNLGELNEALSNALGAGKLFDVDEQSEYVQTILGALPVPPR